MKISDITRDRFPTWDGKGRNTTVLYNRAYDMLIETANRMGYTELKDFDGASYKIFGPVVKQPMVYIVDFLEENDVFISDAGILRQKAIELRDYMREYHHNNKKSNPESTQTGDDILLQAKNLLEEAEKMRKEYRARIKEMETRITKKISELGEEGTIQEKAIAIKLIEQGDLEDATYVLSLMQTKKRLKEEGERLLWWKNVILKRHIC